MAEDTENLTIRLLQEMRGEMREMRSELGGQIAELRDEVGDLRRMVDGNTLILTMIGGMVHNHEERISKLEAHAGV